jgi:predicted DsbA family dithiol-disulfide isomerase
MSDNDTGIHIEVYSDIVCPWCYVGKRRLEKALALLEPAARPNVSWRPFELNPTMPAAGRDRKTYLEAKFGSLERVESMLAQVGKAGKQSGIAFAFERMTRVPNTFDAHRLVWLAEQHGSQEQVVEALFRGYFEEGTDLSDRDALAALAEAGDLERTRVVKCLESDEGVTAVRDEEQRGLQLGILGVPYFHREGGVGLSGAQPPAVMADWLRQTAGKQAPA